MKVYVVTRGQHDAFCTDAIFTTKKAARAYIKAQPEPKWEFERVNEHIEEWVVYETAESALDYLQTRGW